MAARKEQIRELLRGARARIDPSEAGLGHVPRRRSPGLRREDVAVAAGISERWYSWLEQGRELNFSERVLDKVARCLRLSAAEKAYLQALLRRRTAPRALSASRVEGLRRTVRFLPVPALVMTLRWDIVAWNPLARRVFRDYGSIPAAERNLLRIVLTERRYREAPEVHDARARRLLAKFRVDFSQFAADSRFEELIADLKRTVPGFEQMWRDVEVREDLQGREVLQHPGLGELRFDYSSYVPEGADFLRVLMFVPSDARTAEAVSSLVDARQLIGSADEDGVRPPTRDPGGPGEAGPPFVVDAQAAEIGSSRAEAPRRIGSAGNGEAAPIGISIRKRAPAAAGSSQ